ncbi:MAG: MATE family efflux transporter, partial [Eubacterium sp.]|nr:MATE family efflux transporter [Eubacterium sp.]
RKKTQTCISIRRVFKMNKKTSDIPLFINIIITGLPSLARQGMSSLATATMNILARPYGDATIAAMSIVMRLGFILFAVGLGIGQGFQPVSGFNYGAGRYDRVKKATYFTWIFSTIVLIVMGVVMWFICGDLIAVFRNDPAVIEIGIPAMRYQLVVLPALPVCFIGNMLFQSIGKSGRALFLSCLRSGICYIPVILIVTGTFGIIGIQIAQPASDVLSAIITLPFMLSFLKKIDPSHN